MTQTSSRSSPAGERPGQEFREELQITGEQLVATVERLIHEGNVRRILIKHEGQTVLEIPLSVGVVGALLAPMLAAVGAIGAALTNCTVEVIRVAPAGQTMGPPPAPGPSAPLLAGMGGQIYSIARSGMQLFEQGRVNAVMSSTVIDLVSAPMEPGEYRLEINATMAGVEIFLPRSVQFTLEGSTFVGGRTVHDGLYEGAVVWETTRRKLRYVVDLPEQPPEFAIAAPNPERPMRIHFVTHLTMAGIEIYRL